MIGIPLLTNYIQKIVKEQNIADSVDWLNYYATSLLLAFFSLAISAKQYFGSAINCWTPNEFRGGWDKYAENYCFIANSYFVPYDEEVPKDLSQRQDQISYYRWVPIVLAIQAMLFWIPSWFWNTLHKQTAINPKSVVDEALKSRGLHGGERDKEVESLAAYIAETLTAFSPKNNKRVFGGLNATLLYLSIKMLYTLNCIGQLVMLNHFLGGGYYNWVVETALNIVRGEEWQESVLFPRVIMCDFTIRRLANPQRYTIQCVLMMNMINEKLYFFLSFWFLFVALVTAINFFYYLFILLFPRMRMNFIFWNLNKKELKMHNISNRQLNRFVQNFLHPDGVLLIHFLRQHIGGRVTYDLLNELLRLYWLGKYGPNSNTNSTAVIASDNPSKGSIHSTGEKAILLLHRQNRNTEKENLDLSNDNQQIDQNNGDITFSRQNTYKPTIYGPTTLHLPLNLPNYDDSAGIPMFSSASVLRSLNGTASPHNKYSASPDYVDADNMQSNEKPVLNEDIGRHEFDHYNRPRQQEQQISATPLSQTSRRSIRSPVITNLGITKRKSMGNEIIKI